MLLKGGPQFREQLARLEIGILRVFREIVLLIHRNKENVVALLGVFRVCRFFLRTGASDL